MEKKISFAVKGLVYNENRILIVQRSDNKIWELPGGRMEFGETADDTLLRELKEETGLKVEPLNIVGTWNKFLDNWQITGIIYRCKTESRDVTLSEEHSDFKWVEIGSKEFELIHPIFRDPLNII